MGTGAFLLAEAGLLDNRQAVTHWRACARLAAEYPNIRVLNDPIWVRDDHIWTSAGVTAGIDLTLALIEEDLARRSRSRSHAASSSTCAGRAARRSTQRHWRCRRLMPSVR